MRWSNTYISTLRESPQEAEIKSHRLMLRAGLIQKLAGGLYTFLPMGLRSLRKVEAIIRDVMGKHGAIEVLLPILQPKDIWTQSGRWETMRDLMLVAEDRQKRSFVLGPTHEEVITDLVSKRIKSYRDLPKNFYQIQTKFRDEIRPRFGLMRAREFLMKDGYSFDMDDPSAEKSYWNMAEAYQEIFTRCGLNFRMVEADTGVMGGSLSHEFMVLAETGEDEIFSCPSCKYAANRELAKRLPLMPAFSGSEKKEIVQTPGLKSVEEVSKFLNVNPTQLVKTLLYWAQRKLVAVLVRGDVQINEGKLCRFLGVTKLELADEKKVEETYQIPMGFVGPVGLKDIRIIADLSVQGLQDVVVGANEKDAHLTHVNLEQDCKIDAYADLGFSQKGDLCPSCKVQFEIVRGIEVGHVFKLGTKYSQKLDAHVLNPQGAKTPCVMGCYGIGVSRTLASFVEQNSNEDGILWNRALAPYEIVLLPLQMEVAPVRELAEKLYQEMLAKGWDVLLDDRPERAGVKFKDADLIGFPLQVTLGQKSLETGKLEIFVRSRQQKEEVPIEQVLPRIAQILEEL